MRSTAICRARLHAPWGIALAAIDGAAFHVVCRGRCWLLVDDPDGPARALALEPGDLVVLPHGPAHVLADDPATRPAPLAAVPLAPGGAGLDTLSVAGPGAVAELVSRLLRVRRPAAAPAAGRPAAGPAPPGGGRRVGALAAGVGYGAPLAFQKAFRRWAGESPGRYRRRHAKADGDA